MSMKTFGEYIRDRRESLESQRLQNHTGRGRGYSLRAVALAVGVMPSYLCHVETDRIRPSHDLVANLADVLGEDVDVLMALGGKISPDLEVIIKRRPQLFGYLLRELQGVPDDVIDSIVQRVRRSRV